jgi:guanylate kinase
MLYIFFGSSISGKTTLLDLAKKKFSLKCIITKVSTREVRGDNDDIVNFPEGFDNIHYYKYKMYGHEYGFLKKDIKKACNSKDSYFAICSDKEIVKEMKNYFGDKVVVTFFLLNISKDELRKTQLDRGLDENEIEQRINQVALINEIFLTNMDLFDEVVFSKHLKNVEERYEKYLNNIILRG